MDGVRAMAVEMVADLLSPDVAAVTCCTSLVVRRGDELRDGGRVGGGSCGPPGVVLMTAARNDLELSTHCRFDFSLQPYC